MELLEIKHEFHCDSGLQCHTCLSIGRRLTPLGQYTDIYKKLINDTLYSNLPIQPLEICWECRSLLRKVSLFQQQAKKAHNLLLNNQNFTYGTLSNLVAITLNDTHETVYLNEYNVQKTENSVKNDYTTDTSVIENQTRESRKESTVTKKVYDENNLKSKKKIGTEDIDKIISNKHVIQGYNDDSNRSIFKIDVNMRKDIEPDIAPLMSLSRSTQSDDNNISCYSNNEELKKKFYNYNYIDSEEDINFENDYNPEKQINDTCTFKTEIKSTQNKKPKSHWAIKRAALNKKPKFKTVLIDFDEAFTKVQISDEEFAKYMAKKRDSEYYKSKRFKCCVLGFGGEKELIIHNEKQQSEELSDASHICESSICDKRHLAAENTQHYAVHQCIVCRTICRDEEEKASHLQREHRKVVQCLKCDLKFSTRREFFKHHKEWHETYTCDHCGASFKMRCWLKEHLRKQHSPFSCVPCNKTFARYGGLWLHNKLAHAPPSQPAYCVECDTHYKDIYRYKWHLYNSAKHSPKKKVTVPCSECEKTFTKKTYMKDHYNLVHLKLFRHRCEPCDKNFTRNAELVKHRRRKHEGFLPPRDKMCYICGRGFSTNKILRNHIKTHGKQDATITGENKPKEKQTIV